MKLGIYAFWDLAWDGRTISGLGCHIRYLKEFLKYAEGIRLFTTIDNRWTAANADSLTDARLEVVPVPWRSWMSVWLHAGKLRRLVKDNLNGLDAMYVRLFDPCPWVFTPACEAKKIGMVFHIVGDPIAGIFQRDDWSLPGKWLRRALFYPEELLVFRAARRHTVLIERGELVRLFRDRGLPGEPVVSSTLEAADFCEREDTCGDSTLPTILYAGFIRPAKRLEVLLEAAGILWRGGHRFGLRIVGPVEPEGYQAALEKQGRAVGLGDCLKFVGYVPMGAALNAEFRAADIFAFPSATEGNPRVLLEAAANGLPLVTTDVGGVRDLFVHEDSALIVPINDAPAMAGALARFLEDSQLRRRCIHNAREIARQNRCEHFILDLVWRLKNTKSL